MNIPINDYRQTVAEREAWRHTRIQALCLPDYTFDEELLNCLTHAAGAVLGLVGLVICLNRLLPAGAVGPAVPMAVFCLAMVLLYTNSALYHGWELTRAKQVFQVLDHCTIFLLIAGTYAPFTMMVMGGLTGFCIMAAVGAVSVLGIILNLIDMKKYKKISMACYLLTGWCIILAYPAIAAALSSSELLMLVGGGVVYTVGAGLYGLGVKVRYMHTVWHLFVLAGSLLHFLCLYSFVATHY